MKDMAAKVISRLGGGNEYGCGIGNFSPCIAEEVGSGGPVFGLICRLDWLSFIR